jgi:hypothetical protein
MTMAALERKVAILEKAVLNLRFQVEQSHALVTGDCSPVTFSTKEFAGKIGRSRQWVSREIAGGRIKAYGRPALIPGSEILRFL